MCFGALTITNLGMENLNHYKKTILEIHSSEVCGCRGSHRGARGSLWRGAKERRGSNPSAFPTDQGAAVGVPFPVSELARLWRPLLCCHPH